MSKDFNPIAAHNGEYVPTCPKCGEDPCNHSPEEMYLFALDALAEAEKWYDELARNGKENESSPTQSSVDQ